MIPPNGCPSAAVLAVGEQQFFVLGVKKKTELKGNDKDNKERKGLSDC